MKDDLHELIDGELPDEQAAELLHLLSVDPEKRSAFRQQMNLQRNLYRNERFKSLSAFEEGEMLDRVMRTAGDTTGGSGRFARRGVVMLALGFLVGSGAGYAGHSLVADGAMAARPVPDTVRIVEQIPVPTVVNLNRDSIVASIRDSLADAQKTAAVTTAKRTTPRVASTKRSTRPSTTNDLTGAPEARRQRPKRSRK